MIQCHAFHCHIRCCHLHITGCLFISYFRCDNGFTCRFRCHFAVIVHCRNICCIAFPCNRSVCCIIRFYCCSQGCFLSSNQFQAGLIQCHAFHCHFRCCHLHITGYLFISYFRCDGGFTCRFRCHFAVIIYCCNGFVIAAPCYSFVCCIIRFYCCSQGCFLSSNQFQCRLVQFYTGYGNSCLSIHSHFTAYTLAINRCSDSSCACRFCGHIAVAVYLYDFRFVAFPSYCLIGSVIGVYSYCQFFSVVHIQCQISFIQCHTGYTNLHIFCHFNFAGFFINTATALDSDGIIRLQFANGTAQVNSAISFVSHIDFFDDGTCRNLHICNGCNDFHAVCLQIIQCGQFICIHNDLFQICAIVFFQTDDIRTVFTDIQRAFQCLCSLVVQFQTNRIIAICFFCINIAADLTIFKKYRICAAASDINIAVNGHTVKSDFVVFHIAVNIQIFPYRHISHGYITFCDGCVPVSAAAAVTADGDIPAGAAGARPIIIVIRIIRFACIILCFHRIGTDTAGNAADINGHGVDVTAAFDGNFIFYGHIFHFPLGKVDGSLIGVFGDFHIFDSGIRAQFQVCFCIQCQITYFCVNGDITRQLFIHDNVCIIAAGKFTDFLKCGFFHGGLAAGFHCGILLIHHHFFDVTILEDDFTAAVYNEFAFDSHIIQCNGLCTQTIGDSQVTCNGGIFQFGLGQKHIFFFGFFFIFFLVAGLVVHGLIQCQNSFGSCQNTVRSKGAIGIACHDACFADSAHHAFCPIGNGIGIGVAVRSAFILFQIQNTGNHSCRFLSGNRVIGTENAVAVTGNITCCHTSLDGIFTPVMAGYVGEISVAALCVAHGVIHQHYKFRSGNHVVRAESPIGITADISFIHPLIDGILCPVPLNICGRTKSGDAHSHGSRQHSCNGNRMFLLHKLHPHINEKLFMEFLSSSNATVLCFSLRNNCFPPFVRKP